MKKSSPNLLLLIGTIASFSIGAQYVPGVYRALWVDPDIWWTGQSAKLPIEETRGSFELYIRGKLLQRHLSDQTLFVLSRKGTRDPVASRDVRIRLNNYYRVKGGLLAKTVFTGPAFGAALTLLVLGLMQSLRRKRGSGSD